MKNLNCKPRNTVRVGSARLPERSPSKKADCHVKGTIRLPTPQKPTVRTKRARGQQVDAVFGAGREDMSAEYVARSLARIIRRGVRSATVREVAGVPVIFSAEIPVGTFALRTADRITAYRSDVPYVEVLCEATGIASVA